MKLLRFADLKAMGVVRNWPTLKLWIQKENFPPGIKLGANTRAWSEIEIQEWLAGRRSWGQKAGGQ